jgi:hypothetical protein
MTVRELLDELTGYERLLATATTLVGDSRQREALQRKLEACRRRIQKAKARIRACLKPHPVAKAHQPPMKRRAA